MGSRATGKAGRAITSSTYSARRSQVGNGADLLDCRNRTFLSKEASKIGARGQNPAIKSKFEFRENYRNLSGNSEFD